MTPEKRKLGLVVGANPASAKALLAVRLAEAAIADEVSVLIFLISDGLYLALESITNKSLLKRFQALAGRGAKITLCSVMLKSRGVPERAVNGQIEIGSLLHFVELINECDQVLFFME